MGGSSRHTRKAVTRQADAPTPSASPGRHPLPRSMARRESEDIEHLLSMIPLPKGAMDSGMAARCRRDCVLPACGRSGQGEGFPLGVA